MSSSPAVSLQYFWFLIFIFFWQDIVKISSSLTKLVLYTVFLLLTINKILNLLSLAANFGVLRTDQFRLCCHFSQKALGHPC